MPSLSAIYCMTSCGRAILSTSESSTSIPGKNNVEHKILIFLKIIHIKLELHFNFKFIKLSSLHWLKILTTLKSLVLFATTIYK